MEFWRCLLAQPPRSMGAPELAKLAEDTGWDGGYFGDSQNILPDVYVQMGLGIAATSTLRFGLGASNADTRDPAVTASAIATAQYYSGGRVTLGIARGDSAVHKLGRNPVPIAKFEDYLAKVQAYLRGEAPVMDTEGAPASIPWIANASEAGMAKPPMDVAATGPKVIAIAARHAEQVAFSVGADPARVKWAVEQARAAEADAGRAPGSLSLGAYVQVAVEEDLALARNLVRGLVAVHTRFNAMNTEKVLETVSGAGKEAAAKVSASFQAAKHGQNASPAAQAISDDYIDSYAVIGSASRCVERLLELTELGIERFYLLPPGAIDSPPGTVDEQCKIIGEQVVSAVKQQVK